MRFWTVGLDHVGENSFSPAFKPPRNGARTWKEELRGFTAVWLSRPPSQSTPKNNKRSRTILFVPARLSAFRPFNPGFPWPSPFQAPLKLLSSALLALYYPHLAPFLGHLPSAIAISCRRSLSFVHSQHGRSNYGSKVSHTRRRLVQVHESPHGR